MVQYDKYRYTTQDFDVLNRFPIATNRSNRKMQNNSNNNSQIRNKIAKCQENFMEPFL